MPRDGSSQYTQPFPPVEPDTTIESEVYNGFVSDVSADLNFARPIVAGGTGATNAAQARINLKVEVAGQQVTNYDSHIFENGSFYSHDNATGAPVARYFVGTVQLLGSDPTKYQSLEMRTSDAAQPELSYTRQKVNGVWGDWQPGGITTANGITGFGSGIADMFFGLAGESPNSSFVVNSESDASGTNLFSVGKAGGFLFKSIAGSTVLTIDALGGSYDDIYFSNVGQPRFLFRNEGNSFFLYTFNDSSQIATTALAVDRYSGCTTVPDPILAGHIATKNYVDTAAVATEGDSVIDGELTVEEGVVITTEGLTVTAGGVEVVDGGVTVTAGGVTITAGGLTINGGITRFTGSTGTMAHATPAAKVLVRSGGAAGDGAYLAFERPGTFAAVLGLESDNVLRYGGWSHGAQTWRVMHEGLANVSFANTVYINGDTHIRGSVGNNARVILEDETGVFKSGVWWNRTLNRTELVHASGGTISMASDGRVFLGTGFFSRSGTDGPYNANNSVVNFNWTGTMLQAWADNTNIGNVSVTSDYRTKKDVTDLGGMWDTVKALRPVRYTQATYRSLFTEDSAERWGFIAHELQETTVESAATGRKDAPDVVQSPNPMTIIAALTRALQEAMGRIEALEAR